MSTEVDVERLNMVNFKPKSEKTQISSSVAPKAMAVIFAVSEVGFVTVPLNWGWVVENTRMELPADSRTRLDEGDQINDWRFEVKSADRAMTRVISRERVPRIVSFEGRAVAMYAPSGLGSECADAMDNIHVRETLR